MIPFQQQMLQVEDLSAGKRSMEKGGESSVKEESKEWEGGGDREERQTERNTLILQNQDIHYMVHVRIAYTHT